MDRFTYAINLGDRFALWFMRVTVRWMTDSSVERCRSDVESELGKYPGTDGPGHRFARKFLALFDGELARRARKAGRT